MNSAKREAIFARFKAANPKPQTELEYASSFQLLIAVILSAQATDRGVNIATRGLFAAAPDAFAMRELGEVGIRNHIRTIGLFNAKAANVAATCEQLCERHQGEVPRDRDALEALPGVGRKTANVVLNTAYGEPTMAVDTHIFRVSNRTRIASGKTVRQVEDRLMKHVPKAYLVDAHHWLILHGRYTCKARKPECSNCLIADLCDYRDKTDV
jgi:endonuclease-3